MDSLGEAVPGLKSRPISVALSGGGFRASLFSLGALLYLVDSEANGRVRSISSVSGSSVLNGLVLQAGDFSQMTVGQIDEVAVDLLGVILNKGLIRSSRVAVAAIALIGLLFVWWFCELIFDWPLGLVRWQLVTLFGLVFTTALLRGDLISALLSRAFFRPKGRVPTSLGENTSEVVHTFCATDLNSAEPVHIRAGGSREFKTAFGTGISDGMALKDVVRSSSAFPGVFPPKRLRLNTVGLTWKDRTQRVPAVLLRMAEGHRRPVRVAGKLLAKLRPKMPVPGAMYLADGGVYDNLATSAHAIDRDEHLLLVVDSSAPLKREPLRHLMVPLVGEVAAVARSMAILYNNTVEPRIVGLEMRGAANLGGTATGMFPVLVRMTDNTSHGLNRLARMAKAAGVVPQDASTKTVFGESWSRLREQWNEAASYMSKKHWYRTMAAQSFTVPTTFNALDRTPALGLILHGYLLTMLSMSFTDGSPSGSVQMERFERLLDLQVGSTSGLAPSHEDTL